MVVNEYEGDIFASGRQTLVCPVNTVGVMGAGLALQFRKRVPGLLQAYQTACESGELSTSKVWVFKPYGVDFQVLCLASKEHWRKPSKLSYIEDSLHDLANRYEALGIESLAIPPVGCGLGQLDYVHCVKPRIEKILGVLDIPIDIVFL